LPALDRPHRRSGSTEGSQPFVAGCRGGSALLRSRGNAYWTGSSLADLYDPLTMPTELLKAHNANNRAVMDAYGFSIKMSEADCVAELMRMYQKLTKEK